MKKLSRTFYRRWIRPISGSPDEQRREYIFNVLIGFISFAAFAATLSSGITHLLGANAHDTDSVPTTFVFLLLSIGLWWQSRRGRYKLGAYALVVLLLAASLQLTLAWSIELPMAELLTVLVVIVAGLVISSRAVVATTLIVSLWTLGIGYMQTQGLIVANTSWLTKRLEFSDAVGLVVIYGIVGAIAWLANNEIDNLLKRAWQSEQALARERDQLEVTVVGRTRELKEIQRERELELQNFAEFGRVSAGLVHDVSTPLTAASLSVEQMGATKSSELVADTLASLHHIENYIASARKQLQRTSQPAPFLARHAIAEVVSLLRHQARGANVQINITTGKEATIYGDIVAFHRVMANIIMNAIESYAGSDKKKRIIQVSIEPSNDQVVVSVHDEGTGIDVQDLPHIFESFYTSKKRAGRGLGLGLPGAKHIIEQDFKGQINATSQLGQGTTFTIGIPIHEQKNTTKHPKRG